MQTESTYQAQKEGYEIPPYSILSRPHREEVSPSLSQGAREGSDRRPGGGRPARVHPGAPCDSPHQDPPSRQDHIRPHLLEAIPQDPLSQGKDQGGSCSRLCNDGRHPDPGRTVQAEHETRLGQSLESLPPLADREREVRSRGEAGPEDQGPPQGLSDHDATRDPHERGGEKAHTGREHQPRPRTGRSPLRDGEPGG